MPTIGQLPSLSAVDAADEIPLSHAGTTQSISVGALLADVQPAILAPTGTLLGRESLGPGGPEYISVGIGLNMQSSALVATGADHAHFPSQTCLNPNDQVVLSSDGSPMLLELSYLRGLFAAGENILINSEGTISSSVDSVSGGADSGQYNIAGLPIVTSVNASDLIGISQGGTADTITYRNFLNGLTIDEAQQASSPSDSDTIWVAQGSSTMVRQTFSAVWAWIVSQQTCYKCPVVELTTNTTLDGIMHNGRILVCSQPIALTPVFGNMGAGFVRTVINLSGASVTLGSGIVTSSGATALPNGLSCMMQGVTYSAGSIIYASMSSGPTQSSEIPAGVIPGQVLAFIVNAQTSTTLSLTWSAPAVGTTPISYTINYRLTGTATWTTYASGVLVTEITVSGLSSNTGYDFEILANNSAGAGPASGVETGSTTAPTGVAPGQVTGLTASPQTSSTLLVTWSVPNIGTAPITYTVSYRPTGTSSWTIYAFGLLGTSATVSGLSPSTSYDFEIFATNPFGNGIPSSIIAQSTEGGGTPMTAVSWNVIPSGNYLHSSGSIGVNAQVTPSNAPVQFAFAQSTTVPPIIWTPAMYVNTNLWGAYVNTPTTPGTWYCWVEGTNGSLPTVCLESFTVT